MPVPVTKAQEFVDEVAPILNDPTLAVSRTRLQNYLAQARILLREVRDPEGRGALHTVLGMLHSMLDQREEALSEMRFALVQDRRNPYHLNNFAMSLIECERYEEAVDYLREARALHPPRELTIGTWLNEAVACFRLGQARASRAALEQAIALTDTDGFRDLFRIAIATAKCGHDDDAAEFLARYLAAAQGLALDDTPAVDVIRAAPDALLASARGAPALNEAIARVLARDEAPVPDDMQINSAVVLGPEAWEAVESLLESPPEPSDALRRLAHER